MQNLIRNLVNTTVNNAVSILNCEGAPAWKLSPATALKQMAMTGTMTNTFYADSKSQVEQACDVLDAASAQEIYDAIILGRNEGFIRAFPILGLFYLSQKDPVLFHDAFNKVILTGNDLHDFIAIMRTRRGFGRSVKRAMSEYLSTVSPFMAIKYRRQFADAIRIARFKGDDPLYAYILSIYKTCMRVDDEKIRTALEKYPILADQENFKTAVEAGDLQTAKEILAHRKLEVSELTYLYAAFDAELWQLIAQATPVMRFLKMMAKFQRSGVELPALIDEKLNVENLIKAKVFPFRLFTAIDALSRENKNEPVIKTLWKKLDDYTKVVDFEIFNNYSWAIAPDVSGSMHMVIGGQPCTTISAMFVGILARALQNVTILPWDTRLHSYKFTKKTSIFQHVKNIENLCGGGTYMNVPVDALYQKKIKVDILLMITDSEEYGPSWFNAWKQYRRMNPHARAILIRIDPYHSSPFPEEIAREFGIYQVFGWNDAVLGFIKSILQQDNNKEKINVLV